LRSGQKSFSFCWLGANLPVCPNLPAGKRNDTEAPLVLVEIWAARQRRPDILSF
jgi:hypothetical protein